VRSKQQPTRSKEQEKMEQEERSRGQLYKLYKEQEVRRLKQGTWSMEQVARNKEQDARSKKQGA
jgi:hypothetical protein